MSQFYNKDPQILGTKVQNLVALAPEIFCAPDVVDYWARCLHEIRRVSPVDQ